MTIRELIAILQKENNKDRQVVVSSYERGEETFDPIASHFIVSVKPNAPSYEGDWEMMYKEETDERESSVFVLSRFDLCFDWWHRKGFEER